MNLPVIPFSLTLFTIMLECLCRDNRGGDLALVPTERRTVAPCGLHRAGDLLADNPLCRRY